MVVAVGGRGTRMDLHVGSRLTRFEILGLSTLK
jgi:hypothetical protein